MGFGVALAGVEGADLAGAGQAAAAGGPQAASPEVAPFLLAVPALREVEGDVSGVSRDV